MGEDENRKGADGALAIGKFARKADAVRDRKGAEKEKQAGNLGGKRQKLPFLRRSEEGKRKESKKACGRLNGNPQRTRGKCGRRSGRNLCANKNARFPIGKAAVKATCFRSAREQKKNRNFCADSIDGAVFYCPREGIKKISLETDGRNGRKTLNRFYSGAEKPKKDFLKSNACHRKEKAYFRAENGKGKEARKAFLYS